MRYNFKKQEQEEVRLDSLFAGDFFEFNEMIYILCNKSDNYFPKLKDQLFAINLSDKYIEIFEKDYFVIPIKQENRLELSY